MAQIVFFFLLPCCVIGNGPFWGVFKWKENNLGMYLFLRTTYYIKILVSSLLSFALC